MKTTAQERLFAGWWSALLAGLAGEVGLRTLLVGMADAWAIRSAVVIAAFSVGGWLARFLWSAARATSFMRGALWGMLGAWLTVQLAALAVVVCGMLLDGNGSTFDADAFGLFFGILMLSTLLGWWLIALAGVASGCGFVAIFSRPAWQVLE